MSIVTPDPLNPYDETYALAIEFAQAHPRSLTAAADRFGTELANWAFAQDVLRDKAKERFVDVENMWFGREALEQATHPAVAAYHASKFPAGKNVVDLTCGIGADLKAIAERGPAVGVELEPIRAACAAHNVPSAQIVIADAFNWWANQADYAIADPARRIDGRRSVRFEDFSPDPIRLAEMMRPLKLGLVKLSPMCSDDDLDRLNAGIEFVSYRRECREALANLGTEADQGNWAVHLESGDRLPAGLEPIHAPEPLRFLYDCDPAAIRAHALDAFGFQALGDHPGYLTSNTELNSPWLRRYEVLYAGKGDLKSTRAAARKLGLRAFELKQRGAGLEPAPILRALDVGSDPVSFVAYRVGKSIRHLLVRSEVA